jgi:hypothetical protein
MIEQLMERTDPGRAEIDDEALAAVFDRPPRRPPAPARPPVLRWAGYALAAAAVVGGILAVPLMISPPTPPMSGDYPYYSTLGEMEEAATAVLVVDVESEAPGTYQGIGHEVMTARVVIDAARVHRTGETILIKEMPGEDALRIGGRFVVFIVEYPEEQVPASLVNPTQGAYLVQDGQAIAREGNPVQLDRELLQSLGLQYGG